MSPVISETMIQKLGPLCPPDTFAMTLRAAINELVTVAFDCYASDELSDWVAEAASSRGVSVIIKPIIVNSELVSMLEDYQLGYTDDELARLANCVSGMGEISPKEAWREIRRRAMVASARAERHVNQHPQKGTK